MKSEDNLSPTSGVLVEEAPVGLHKLKPPSQSSLTSS